MGIPEAHRELMLSHEACMALAIAQARLAEECGEIPVGAVVVKDGTVIGEGHNRTLADCDPTAHAEIVAIRAASKTVGSHRLMGCSLYVTLEPCAMCMGGVLHSRLEHVYFGAYDPKAGACGSVVNLPEIKNINHHCSVHGGLSQDACSLQLASFFQRRRLEQRLVAKPLREDALRLPEGKLNAWMPGCSPLCWDDLKSAEGLRVRGWGNPNSAPDAGLLVLCLHGATSWSYLYRDLLLADLPGNTAVWAVDLPGHGSSDKTKHGGELAQPFQLAVLEELLAAYRFDSVHVMAHDMGCGLALGLSASDHNHISSLTLCNPVSCLPAVTGNTSAKSPGSMKQLRNWLHALSAGRSELVDVMCAPYPDAGHLKGLLRHLQSKSGDALSACNEPFSPSNVSIALHAGAIYKVSEPHLNATYKVHQNSDFFLGLPNGFGALIDLNAIHGQE